MTQLFHAYCEELPEVVNDELKSYIYTNYTKAVEHEDALIDLVFVGEEMNDLTKSDLKTYVRYLQIVGFCSWAEPIFKQKDNLSHGLIGL